MTYSVFGGTLNLAQLNSTLFGRSDNEIPPDSITEKITPCVISVGLLILMTVLASLGIILSFIFLVFNITYRHAKCVKPPVRPPARVN